MIRLNKYFFLLLLTLPALQYAGAQDSITIRDAEEIKYKSESLIKREFKDLLNNIANTDIDLAETKKVIFNSHSGTRNKIFLSPKVLLEDDINPNFHSSNNSRDIEIEKYLNDFDLLYKKSDAPSVSFNDVKASNIKKGKTLYVKVYFTSFFRNPNKTNDTAYTLNNRVAEIRIEKEKSKWAPYIARIGFFNPADTANDLSNDILLVREGSIAGTGTDSAAAATAQLSFEMEQKEKARKEAIEEDRREMKAYNDLMDQGDKAFDISDFTSALSFYSSARDMRPYDPLPPGKIKNAKKAQSLANVTSAELYTQYTEKARHAAENRKYEDAIDYYNKAIAQKQDAKTELEKSIRELTAKYRIVSELDQKYQSHLYKEAIKEYDAAIKKDNTNSDYYLGRGKCYEALKDFSRAMKDYTQAYNKDDRNFDALHYRAELYKLTGDYFKAHTDYKIYALNNKDSVSAYEKLAELQMLTTHNIDEAIKHLDDGLKVAPAVASLYLKKGLLLLEKNDYRAADNNFSSVIKLDSNHALAYYNRGKSQLLMNHAVTAGVDFEAARQKGLDAANIKNIEAYAAAYFQRAAAKFNEAAKDSAIKLADYAIAINPLNSVYRFARGDYYFSVNNYKEAINNYDQALALDKAYIDALYKRGLAWYHLGNYKTAIENYNSAVKLNPQLFAAQKGLGDAYLALAEYNNASGHFENFFQTAGAAKTPLSPALAAEAYNSLGKSYFAVNNYDKALAAFKNAVKKNPSLPEAWFNKGLTLYKTGGLTDATDDILKAISFENYHYQWHYYLGRAYQDKKEFQNAAISYNNCVKLDTLVTMPDAVYYRGYSNYLLQNYPAALPDYQKIYPVYYNTPGISLNNEMGNIYLNLSKYDTAYDYYNRAYLKDSGNGSALYGMASTLFLKGKADDALVWFEKSFQTKKVNYNDIKKDKLIAALREDKRFKSLLKKYY